jgi:hypothetical protein
MTVLSVVYDHASGGRCLIMALTPRNLPIQLVELALCFLKPSERLLIRRRGKQTGLR